MNCSQNPFNGVFITLNEICFFAVSKVICILVSKRIILEYLTCRKWEMSRGIQKNREIICF